MSPKNVASINVDKGIPRIGDEILIIILGSKGVILKNKRYENTLWLWSFNILLNFIRAPGIILTISGFPITQDTQYHIAEPIVADTDTMQVPSTPPNRAPERMLRKTGPGIAKVCRNKYIQTKAAISP